MATKRILCNEIEVGKDRRKVKPARVDELAESIGESALVHPIAVREKAGGGFILIAGAHRLAAMIKLGRDKIDANILDLDDLRATIAECDENLIAPDLAANERARETARRKQAWLAVHADAADRSTTAKAKGGKGGPGRAKGDKKASTVDAFQKDTAKKTGRSVGSVRRDTRIGEGLSDEAEEILADHPILDSPTQLEKLAALPDEAQVAAAEALAADEDLTLRDVIPEKEAVPAEILPTWKYLSDAAPELKREIGAMRRRVRAIKDKLADLRMMAPKHRDIVRGTLVINLGNLDRALDSAERDASRLIPSVVCSACAGDGCAKCGKAGWLAAVDVKTTDKADARGKAALAKAGR